MDALCQACQFTSCSPLIDCQCGVSLCETCKEWHVCKLVETQELEPAKPLVLRVHQQYGINGVHGMIKAGHRRVVLVAPCGSGKRVMACWWSERAKKQERRVLFVTSRKVLVNQFHRELDRMGLAGEYNVMMADETTPDKGEPICVASIQTLRERHFYDQFGTPSGVGLPPADLIIVDEAHMDLASYTTLFSFYPKALVIGLTATPVGPTGKSLAGTYPAMFIAANKAELIEQGLLVPTRMYAPSEPDVEGVKITHDEFMKGELAIRVRQCTVFADVFKVWQPYSDLPTVCFAPGVEFARDLAERFTQRGHAAACLEAKTKPEDRQKIFDGLRDGSVRVIVSVGVIREGLDVPELAVGIDLQPTLQLRDYVQKTGRICRPAAGKKEGVWLDFCLDSETEILTQRGWIGRTGIQDSDMVAGFDMASGDVSWQPITSRIDRKLLSGERMIEAISDRIDIRVTGNHCIPMKRRKVKWKLPMPKRDESGNRKWNGRVSWKSDWQFVEAALLADVPTHAFRIPIAGSQFARGMRLTNDELRFIGWFLTDGNLSGGRTVRISQACYQPQLASLRLTLASLGFDHTEREWYGKLSKHKQILLAIPKGTGNKGKRGWHRLEKYLDKDLSPLLEECTANQFEIMLHAIHLGDGEKGRTSGSYRITTGNKRFADRLQSLCVRRGFKCNISTYQPTGPISKKEKYVLNIQKRMEVTIHGKNHPGNGVRFRESTVNVGERVWCVSNPLETLFIRRNGKVAIVGNSGSYWRHGHPDEDFPWDQISGNESTNSLRERMVEKGDAKEPISCPKCHFVRKSGDTCPKCGFKAKVVMRKIRMLDGRLVFKKPPKKKKPAEAGSREWEQKNWTSTLFAAGSSGKTFKQALHMYNRKTGRWPPADLHNMPPQGHVDWGRKVGEVYEWTLPKKKKQKHVNPS